MFGSIRLVMVGLLITGIAGAGVYVMKLRSDNAILKANQVKLEEAVSSQKELIVKQQEDFKEILGKIAIEKTGAINRIINKGSDNASRCIEIASGAELTEEERNATKKSEINRECPGIANPNYVPY